MSFSTIQGKGSVEHLIRPLALQTRASAFLERALIFGTVILIPYDLPVLHQAWLPLIAIAGLLELMRRDLAEFLAFVRDMPLVYSPALVVYAFAILSLYCNLNSIQASYFQDESGWLRGVAQGGLLLISLIFPFYFAFCLRRVGDWQSLIVRAAWWSLPIPLLVGLLQLANIAGVPGVAHLPYVSGPYTGGFFRITSVARESSWFGSFVCVIFPFLLCDISGSLGGWRRAFGIAGIILLLIIFFFGYSKSAYGGLALEIGLGTAILMIFRLQWRAVSKVLLAVALIICAAFLVAAVAPNFLERVTDPIVQVASGIYLLFEPLIFGDTKFLSIGTRFGMSAAGTAMGQAHPVFGVGLGQFGFYAHNYLPLWGLNGETRDWLSNDMNEWPSTSNLYTRLLAEIGILGMCAYILFRVVLAARLGLRLLDRNNSTWSRDAKVICVLVALVAFDFHRDSFINLDVWTAIGMAIACTSALPDDKMRAAGTTRSRRRWSFFLFAAIAGACAAFCAMLLEPVTYQASATLGAKPAGIIVSAPSSSTAVGDTPVGGLPRAQTDGQYLPPTVRMDDGGGEQFSLFQTYWASRTVAERLMADFPELVHAVLQNPTPEALAGYIESNITLLMFERQNTLTLQYRNSDPELAKKFLVATITETDRAVAAVGKARAAQSREVFRLASVSGLDAATKQDITRASIAQDLQSMFDAAGDNMSFDYIEHPAAVLSSPSPAPANALRMALLLGALTAVLFLIGQVLWLENN